MIKRDAANASFHHIPLLGGKGKRGDKKGKSAIQTYIRRVTMKKMECVLVKGRQMSAEG